MSAAFCPLTKGDCREDCSWAAVEYEIDEDGVAREVFCAVSIIAGWFYDQAVGGDEE